MGFHPNLEVFWFFLFAVAMVDFQIIIQFLFLAVALPWGWESESGRERVSEVRPSSHTTDIFSISEAE